MTKLFALAAVAALTLGAHAALAAPSQQLIGFTDVSGLDDISYSNATGVISGSSIAVTVTDYTGSVAVNTPGILSFTADTSGQAGNIFGPIYFQDISSLNLTITDTTGTETLLSATATGGNIVGGGSGYSISGQNLTFNDGISLSSQLTDLSGYTDYAYQINLGAPDSGPTVDGTNFDDFNAPLSPSVVTGALAAPEPASLALISIAGVVLLRRKRA